MSGMEEFDEKHASDALGFFKSFSSEGGGFKIDNPVEYDQALEASVFLSILTNSRPELIPVNDERITRAKVVLSKLIQY